MAKSGCYRNGCRRLHIHCVVLHRHWHLAAEGDPALVHILTLLCYSYETISVNLPASVLDTIYFMSKTSCAIEFHNVIMLCGKVHPFVHFKSVAWLDFIWFHSLYHRKWWRASTAFTSLELFLKSLKLFFCKLVSPNLFCLSSYRSYPSCSVFAVSAVIFSFNYLE